MRPNTALYEELPFSGSSDYAPEQILGTLAAVHADNPSLQDSHETIYTAIYAMPRGELSAGELGCLRFWHAKRRPRALGEEILGRTRIAPGSAASTRAAMVCCAITLEIP
jgi:transposase, IS30 family